MEQLLTNESSPEFRAIYDAAPLARPAVGWLKRNGADPNQLVTDAIRDLWRRGRSLPRERRTRYALKVVLGEFLARWAKKHHGRSVSDFTDEEVRETELKPFACALIALTEEREFAGLTSKFVRKRIVEHMGLSIGGPEDFSAFAMTHTDVLAERFLQNFDSSRAAAARQAVRYLQTVAVSHYLVRRTRPIRTDAPNFKEYLEQSRRLSPRTVLAIKLAYLPALLTHDEREVLREHFGFTRGIGQRLRINEISERLGYKTPAALSRKLYRVRQWCRRSMATSKKGRS